MDLGKQWESAWRPELLNTMVVLCHGVADLFYVASSDQKKDSNHQLTVLTHALEEIASIVEEKCLPMPARLSIQQDNTAREGRNQWTMLWGGPACRIQLLSVRELVTSVSTFSEGMWTHRGNTRAHVSTVNDSTCLGLGLASFAQQLGCFRGFM